MVTTKTMDQNIPKTFYLILLALYFISISHVNGQSTPTGKYIYFSIGAEVIYLVTVCLLPVYNYINHIKRQNLSLILLSKLKVFTYIQNFT